MPPISGQTVCDRPVPADQPRLEPDPVQSPIPSPSMLEIVEPKPLEDETELPTPLVSVDIVPMAIGDVELDVPPPAPPPQKKRTPTLPRVPFAVVERRAARVVGAQLMPQQSRYAIVTYALIAGILYVFDQLGQLRGVEPQIMAWIRGMSIVIIGAALAAPYAKEWKKISADFQAPWELIVAAAVGAVVGANAPAAVLDTQATAAALVFIAIGEELFFRVHFARALRSDGSPLAVPVIGSALAFGVLQASAFGWSALAFGVLAGAVYAWFQHFTGRAMTSVICHATAIAVIAVSRVL